MKALKHTLIYFVFFLLLTSCANKVNTEISRGAEYVYRPGYPEVRFSAIGLFDEAGESHINIHTDVVYGSLIYKKVNGLFTAEVAYNVQIIKAGEENTTLVSERMDTTVFSEDRNVIFLQDVFSFKKNYPAPPGFYRINLSVTDLASNKQTYSTYTTTIPDPINTISDLTDVQLFNKDFADSTFRVTTTYDVNSDSDSLKFLFQVTNNYNQRLNLKTRLLKFQADTLPARPISGVNYSTSSLSYKGIKFNDEEVIQEYNRTLTDNGYVLVQYNFKQLKRGNYRFEIILSDSANKKLQYKARDFGVKSPNYPSLKTPRELAAPLYYLMSEKEYKKLMAIESPTELKHAIDRFWLKNIKSSSTAKSVINLYYERVEEANKQFSNFKEGWKTDMGMVYILFGPPYDVEKSLDKMWWYYSYNQSDPSTTFIFEQDKFKTKDFPFYHYVLYRDGSYFNYEYQQIQLWLTGTILKDNL